MTDYPPDAWPPPPPSWQQEPPPPPRLPPTAANWPLYAWLALGGVAAVAVGSFLPWAEVATVFGSVSFKGTEGDGVLTLVGAAVFGLIWLTAGLNQDRTSAWAFVELLIALGIGAVAVYDASNINEAVDDIEQSDLATASVGGGLWLVMGGAVAMALSCLIGGKSPTVDT